MSLCKRVWVGDIYRDVSEGFGLGETKEGNLEWVFEFGFFR